jgi:hypothetical protein
MGGKPLVGGKPSAVGKHFTGRENSWFQHQDFLGNSSPISPSIPNTTILYSGHPFLGIANPLWGQPNPTRILPKGNFPFQSVNPMIMMQQYLQPPYMGGPSSHSQYIEGPFVQT